MTPISSSAKDEKRLNGKKIDHFFSTLIRVSNLGILLVSKIRTKCHVRFNL